MKFRKLSIFFVLALIAFIAGVGSAHAQMSNEPFQFKNRSGVGGGSVGMSQAHRQMILEQELLNRDTSNPVLRAPDGSLLDYVERDNQIFLRYQGSPFIGSNGGLSDSGIRLNFGISGIGIALFGSPSSLSLGAWISALNSGGIGAGMAPSSSGTPINMWISQLQGL